jgi:hypothetical protein
MPQKGRGFVVGLTWVRGITTIKKYSYGDRKSRQILAQLEGPKMIEMCHCNLASFFQDSDLRNLSVFLRKVKRGENYAPKIDLAGGSQSGEWGDGVKGILKL